MMHDYIRCDANGNRSDHARDKMVSMGNQPSFDVHDVNGPL